MRTEDTIYLVKVSTRLATSMERYDEEEDDYYSDTLEMSREDEIALKRKKDISKTSLHIDDEEEEEEEEDHYRDDYHDQREDEMTKKTKKMKTKKTKKMMIKFRVGNTSAIVGVSFFLRE